MSSFPETQLLQQLEEHRFNEPGRILPELHGKVVSCRCEGSWTRGFIISNLYFFHIVSWTFFCWHFSFVCVWCVLCVWGWSLKKARLSFNSIESQECQCNTKRPASGSMVSLTQTGRKRIKRKRAARRRTELWAPHSSDPVVFYHQSTVIDN